MIRKEGCHLPEYYSSGREPRRNYDERPVRSARPAGSAPRSQSGRPASARPAASRPQGSRPASARPQGQRPQGSRPPQGRRPAPRRRKRTQPRFFIFIALIAIILAVVLILVLGGGKGKDNTPVMPQATPTVAPVSSGLSNATINTGSAPTNDFTADMANQEMPIGNSQENYSTLSQWLGDEDAEITALSQDQMVQVQDLSINPNLPSEWMNVLLLGTDERNLSDSARTDTMIICSINTNTGEVKLSSVMRDMAVKITGTGKYDGTYRMNAVNYFGGPKYTMKTLNECFDLNIQYYATVNFFGFQRIAQALGGITVDITEAEMQQINRNAVNQAKIAYYNGIAEPDQINEYLTSYGPNTQLNGRQTLAYARIRKIDSDYTRSERQRTVLVKLLEKLKTKSAAEILMLVGSMQDQVATNMDWSVITQIMLNVLNNGIPNVETMRLPVPGTYVEERRNDEAMIYDTDWTANALELYNFIYA